MAVTCDCGTMFALRLTPGEDVCGALLREFERLGSGGAAIVAAIGSVDQLRYAVVGTAEDGTASYLPGELTGAMEVASLQGHIGRNKEGEAQLHMHGVFAAGDGGVVAGHVFAARVQLTLEVTLISGDRLGWQAQPLVASGSQPDMGMTIFVPLRPGD